MNPVHGEMRPLVGIRVKLSILHPTHTHATESGTLAKIPDTLHRRSYKSYGCDKESENIATSQNLRSGFRQKDNQNRCEERRKHSLNGNRGPPDSDEVIEEDSIDDVAVPFLYH